MVKKLNPKSKTLIHGKILDQSTNEDVRHTFDHFYHILNCFSSFKLKDLSIARDCSRREYLLFSGMDPL